MSETSIAQGRIEIKGTVHGALNTLVTFFASPEDWEFKQFVSQEALEKYALENQLIISGMNNEAYQGS